VSLSHGRPPWRPLLVKTKDNLTFLTGYCKNTSGCCEVTTRSTKVGYLMYLGNNNDVLLVLKIGMLWHHRWCSKVQSQAQRVNMWPGSHIVTGDALMWLESHLCGQRHTYATGVAYWWCHLWLELQIRDWRRNMQPESQLCDCSSCKFTRGHAHQNSIYSRPFGSDFSFPSHVLLYFYEALHIILVIIDYYSGYHHIEILQSKSETFDKSFTWLRIQEVRLERKAEVI
jgi:hypothetical protein